MAVNASIFDIMGPVMVGPSSSHTAGACKIANVAPVSYTHLTLPTNREV